MLMKEIKVQLVGFPCIPWFIEQGYAPATCSNCDSNFDCSITPDGCFIFPAHECSRHRQINISRSANVDTRGG